MAPVNLVWRSVTYRPWLPRDSLLSEFYVESVSCGINKMLSLTAVATDIIAIVADRWCGFMYNVHVHTNRMVSCQTIVKVHHCLGGRWYGINARL